MASPRKNDFFNGNKGQLWINGKDVLTVVKAKAVRKPKYEELPAVTGDGTVRVKVGETIEFTGTFKYLGTEELDAFNESEDVSLVIANANISGKVTKRLKLDGVTFDEETLVDFEKGKVVEVELSGQAETHEWLQK
ncbi:phage tail tube protein [Cetobacterium sp.]|uniref:phage tail tube protein n=1 Tax=Cetobacterium sp. TaxID=2071632 RepID=UPI003F2DDC75